MQPTPLQKGATTLKSLGRGEMMSLALAYLRSHQLACSLASDDEKHHVSEEVLGDRVSKLSDDELLALLVPISAVGHSD